MNLIFVEDFENDSLTKIYDPKKNLIIALNPIVMYWLEEYGYPYMILDDYYVWQESERDMEEYQNWLSKLDSFLEGCYPKETKVLDFPVTTYFFAMLKGTIDPFIRRAKQFNAIMKSEEPEHITYILKYKKNGIDDELFFKGKTILTRYIDSVSSKTDMIYIPGEDNFSPINWRDNRLLRWGYNYIRYLRFLPAWRIKTKNRILFASPMRQVRECKLMGCMAVVDSPCGWKKVKGNFPYFYHKIPKPLFTDFAIAYDVSYVAAIEVLGERLKYFVNSILPRVFAMKNYYKLWLVQKGHWPDCIIFTRRNKLHHYALLMAARQLKIETVYVRHGWDGYDPWFDGYERIIPYDVSVFETEDEREHYREAYGTDIRTFKEVING